MSDSGISAVRSTPLLPSAQSKNGLKGRGAAVLSVWHYEEVSRFSPPSRFSYVIKPDSGNGDTNVPAQTESDHALPHKRAVIRDDTTASTLSSLCTQTRSTPKSTTPTRTPYTVAADLGPD